MFITGGFANTQVKIVDATTLTVLDQLFAFDPTFTHGGFIAAVFDQFLGFAQGLGDGSGVTGKLEVRFARPTPLNATLRLEGELRERIGRLTYVQGRLLHDGVVTAKATGE